MLRTTLLAGLAGAAASLLVPVTVALVCLGSGQPLLHPGVVLALLAPGVGGVLTGLAAEWQARSSRTRDGWHAERDRLEDRRRQLAAEAAELQALELGLLSDLEDAEAQIAAMHAVSTSLASALHDSLADVELRLGEIAEATGRDDLARLGHQLEEVLELVADVDRFAASGADPASGGVFPLREVVDDALGQARRGLDGRISWTLDGDAPAWVPGSPERLIAVLGAAARAAVTEADGPAHLQVSPVERGGVRGLRIHWSPRVLHSETTDGEALSGPLGARLVDALNEPPVGADDQSLIWWMRSHGEAAVVPPPLPHARALVAATTAPSRARLRRLLTRWGLDVVCARSGAEALARLERQAADVVLLDLDGESLTTLKRLRADEGLRDLPVLLLGPVSENLVWLPTDPGGAMTRPVHHEGLLAGVEAALESRPVTAGSQDARRRPTWRVLALEPNPSVAARLVRLGSDIDAEVTCVSGLEALEHAIARPWDLVLVSRGIHPAEHVADALLELDPATPRRLVLPDTPDAGDLRWASAAGLTGIVRTPQDAVALLELLDGDRDVSSLRAGG